MKLPRLPKIYWSRLFTLPVEAWLGYAAVLSSLRFWTNPDSPQNLVAPVLHPWDYFWGAIYLAAGVLVLFGLLTFKRAYEALGWRLLSTGVVAQVIVLIGFGIRDIWTILSLIGAVVAAELRHRTINRGDVVVRASVANLKPPIDGADT